MEARACPQAAAHPRCPARPRGTGPVAEPRGDGSGTDSSVSPRLHARRAAAATGSRPDAAGRADTQDWLGQTPGPAQTPGPGLSQHLFILPFLQPTLFSFSSPPEGQHRVSGCGMQEEAAANQKSFIFCPFPGREKGGRREHH